MTDMQGDMRVGDEWGSIAPDFLARVDHAFQTDPLVFTRDAVATVFAMLSDRISGGEIKDVRHSLPADLRDLWPVGSQAA